MRGKDTVGEPYVLSKGITPAYAGKSMQSSNQTADYRDHPRLCGEK